MTNNIIEISASGLFDGLYALFLDFLVPMACIWGGCYAVKIVIRAFRRVSGG